MTQLDFLFLRYFSSSYYIWSRFNKVQFFFQILQNDKVANVTSNKEDGFSLDKAEGEQNQKSCACWACIWYGL